MSVCVSQNLEKYRVLWTDFSASLREIKWFSVSKIGPDPAKPTISLALILSYDRSCIKPGLIINEFRTFFSLSNTFVSLLFQLSETADYDEKRKIRLALRQLRQHSRGNFLFFPKRMISAKLNW